MRHEQQTAQGPTWRIQVLGEALVRFEWDADGVFVDGPTQVVIDRPIEHTSMVVEERGDGVQIITEAFQLDYDGASPSAAGLTVRARSNYHAIWRFGQPFENPFARLFSRPINLGGTTRTLDTVDGRCELDDGILSDLGISVLDDSASFQVLAGDEFVAPREGHVDQYVFVHDRDHAGALADFARLTGPTPLIPRYALGNWWSRFHRYSADSYNELMSTFEHHELPFSVAVIDMDWHITDVERRFGHGWTGYTWNRELFPDPEAFLRGLHERGLAVSLNVHPADGVRAFEDAYHRVCEMVGQEPGDELPVDFNLADPVFRRAYFEAVHHPLEAQGVDFWWIDWQQGSIAHNGMDPLWLLNYFHTVDMARRGQRPLILSRYAGPGSHRFPVGFSGDVVSSWASLAFQPEFTATAANIGYGVWSHDIGGHLLGVRDDELALRWLQFGVFSPINRLHSSNDEFSRKEPWQYRDDVSDVMGAFLRLRHALVPYLYSEWADGTPLLKPMYHAYPLSEGAYDVPNQYLFGSQLIVAPVTSPVDDVTQLAATHTWLPEGQFVDVFTGLRYVGGRYVTMHRDIESIPVLAREGAIIPLAARGTRPADLPEQFDVWVAPGADGSYTLVEDDGALDPATVTTRLTWHDATRTLTVDVPTGATQILPETRTWRVRLLGSGIDELREAGVTLRTSPLEWTAPEVMPDEDVRARCQMILERAQTAVAHKHTAARILDDASSPLRAVQALRETPVRGATPDEMTRLPEPLVAALAEVLTASA